ncbi:DNA-binding protein [Halorarum halophilum]|uniref:DNA-binding protein n=1 Tax=Halorarum halophilum TaxID=2743090 RepID=A0A7D5GA54_9EURY|nr:helix-hairpin-helix domain-containing protein [Halobaculum halophilum]QLG26272.1 DNA-binding protein [Halobaculum halophilum]
MFVSVTVDDREPPAVAAALRAHADVEAVEVHRLLAADIVIGRVGFERKSGEDYLRSALGRLGSDLEAQVRKMTDAYDHSYVLLEGDIADVEACWPGTPDASVRGSLASITARFGVPVIPCGSAERLVDMAVRLARKHVDDPSVRQLPVGAVTGRTEPIAKRMYGCIEGIGPDTAAALYDAFPTIESALAAGEDQLRAIDGVGQKRAEAVYTALRSEE